MKDTEITTSTVSLKEQEEIRAEVERIREENFALLGKKGQYTKAMLAQHGKKWWDNIVVMLDSDNKDDRRFALSEINKLQLKEMRTEIGGPDGDPIAVNIISYATNKHSLSVYPQGVSKDANNPENVEERIPKVVEGE